MANVDLKAHIRRLIQNDCASREDNCARAKLAFQRGEIQQDELDDYEDDVKVGNEAKIFYEKLGR